jgi:hypothetical protein
MDVDILICCISQLLEISNNCDTFFGFYILLEGDWPRYKAQKIQYLLGIFCFFVYIRLCFSIDQMNVITGSISAKDVEISFNRNDITLKSNGKISMVIRDIYFAAFERVSPKLKTCELVFVNSDNRPVIITILQKLLPQITALLQCPIINIGQDPENWSRLSSVARKNDWQKKDWLHVFSDDEEESSSEEWLPGNESSEDEDEFLMDNESDSE